MTLPYVAFSFTPQDPMTITAGLGTDAFDLNNFFFGCLYTRTGLEGFAANSTITLSGHYYDDVQTESVAVGSLEYDIANPPYDSSGRVSGLSNLLSTGAFPDTFRGLKDVTMIAKYWSSS